MGTNVHVQHCLETKLAIVGKAQIHGHPLSGDVVDDIHRDGVVGISSKLHAKINVSHISALDALSVHLPGDTVS